MNRLSVLYDPDAYTRGVPLSLLAELRREHAAVWVEEDALASWPGGPGFWLVLRHAEVERVLKTPKTFSSWLGGTQLRDPPTTRDLQYVRQMMLNMDPPAHGRLRRLLAKAFTSKAIAGLEVSIDAHAEALVDNMIGGRTEGTSDFVDTVAAQLPILVLADVLGMPREDRWLTFDWANRVIGFQDPDYLASDAAGAGELSPIGRKALAVRPSPNAAGRMPDPRTRDGIPDLYLYAHLLAEQKRKAPGDDVMSLLLSAVDDETNATVSNEEFENLFWLFAVAGNETLRNGLPGGLIGLCAHPETYQRLRSEPGLVASAPDEMLRWWTPVMIFRRTATTDVDLAGASIKTGQKVVVSFTSANRDETVFDQPDSFVIDRAPNPHVALGSGPHYCLGAHLARVQMRAVLKHLSARIAHIELAGAPIYLRSNFQRGVKCLPIRWKVI